jgi:hypothetical protein
MENKDRAAFPLVTESQYNPGLSKREYFAGLAMQALCKIAEKFGDDPDVIAELSVDYADALLKELNKSE